MKKIENWSVVTSKNCSEFTAKCLVYMGLHSHGKAGKYNHLTILEPGAVMCGYIFEDGSPLMANSYKPLP